MYIDVLVQLKNAQAVKKETVKLPYTKMDEAIVDVLVARGFLAGVERKGRGPKRILEIRLRYADGQGAIRGVKLVSKPSRRIYLGFRDMRPVRHGYGILLLSTPNGIMTNDEARKKRVGGEALFEIW